MVEIGSGERAFPTSGGRGLPGMTYRAVTTWHDAGDVLRELPIDVVAGVGVDVEAVDDAHILRLREVERWGETLAAQVAKPRSTDSAVAWRS